MNTGVLTYLRTNIESRLYVKPISKVIKTKEKTKKIVLKYTSKKGQHFSFLI